MCVGPVLPVVAESDSPRISGPRIGGPRIEECDPDLQHFNSHRAKRRCRRCWWAIHKATTPKWLVAVNKPKWHLMCTICNVPFAPGNTGGNVKRHERRNHSDAAGAPTKDEFKKVWEHVRSQPLGKDVELDDSVGGQKKQVRIRWCLAEADRMLQRTHLAKSSTVALYQDVCATQLVVRYSCASTELDFYHGHLWATMLLKEHGLSADHLRQATLDSVKGFCTVQRDPPHLAPGQTKWKGPQFLPDLYDHICDCVEVLFQELVSGSDCIFKWSPDHLTKCGLRII